MPCLLPAQAIGLSRSRHSKRFKQPLSIIEADKSAPPNDFVCASPPCRTGVRDLWQSFDGVLPYIQGSARLRRTPRQPSIRLRNKWLTVPLFCLSDTDNYGQAIGKNGSAQACNWPANALLHRDAISPCAARAKFVWRRRPNHLIDYSGV